MLKGFSPKGAIFSTKVLDTPMRAPPEFTTIALTTTLVSGKEFWFAQIGGASGRLAPAGKLDQSLSYGPGEFPLGCGSILVVDKSADIKDLLFSWADFFHRESCGKCLPCREGTYRLWEIAKRIKNNDVSKRDKENIEEILWTLSNTTFCPLGNFAAVAWKDAMRMFSDKIFN